MADLQRVQLLSQAFSPSAPIDQQALFAGRISQLMDVLNALNQKGQHAILFGERGVEENVALPGSYQGKGGCISNTGSNH